MLRRTLNLGILAHVDAGKTTLTERLLYAAGVIDELGSVDKGTTQTDSLALEQQRGITIKSAVVSFAIDDVTVNLIDTPGHPDFIAEVERVLSVLDGAVLVVSAVEGVQPQTRVLMRALERLRIPTLVFVNKLDRVGADCETRAERHLRAADAGDGRDGVGRGRGDARRRRDTACRRRSRFGHGSSRCSPSTTRRCSPPTSTTRRACRRGASRALAAQTKRALVHPVFFGSAITGAGVDSLDAGLVELLPATDGDADGPVSGTVFKIERGPAGERIAYARMFSGTVRTRDKLHFGRDHEEKVTAISVFEDGTAVRRPAVSAGQIAKLWGLGEIQIGDRIGEVPGSRAAPRVSAADAGVGRRAARPRRRATAPRRARAARRAGPADRRPAGRLAAGALRLALRRGPEGGHPGDAGRRLRHRRSRSARRRRSTSNVPPAPARRSRSCTRSRTRSSPRSGCASILRLRARVSSSDCRSTTRTVPLYLYKTVESFSGAHARVRRPDAATRASSAGRSRTAS